MSTIEGFYQRFELGKYPFEWPGHWINSSWCATINPREEKASSNPSRGEKVLSFTCSKETVAQAIDIAAEALQNLRELNFRNRMQLVQSVATALASHRDLFAKAMQIEVGKPAWEAYADVTAAERYLAELLACEGELEAGLLAPAGLGREKMASKEGEYTLNPLGIATAYLPFSSPVTSFVLYLSSALMAGCPLILFSSTHGALSSMLFAFLDQHAQLPRGVLNVLFGDFTEFRYALADHRIAAVIYTGSKDHCDSLRHDSHLVRARQLILQSGGKNALVIHSSADLELAVKATIYGAFKAAGQLCSSTSRVFVYRSLLPQFKERLVAYARDMAIGPTDTMSDGPTGGPMMGPVYSKKAMEKFLRFQTMASREAAETILWGSTLEVQGSRGFFVNPGIHVMGEFDRNSAYQSNVLFCPDVAIYGYDVLNNAFDQINDTDACFSLAFIGDPEILRHRGQQLRVPNLIINGPTVETEATLPLAGRSLSGHHRYSGPAMALYLCYPQVTRQVAWNPPR